MEVSFNSVGDSGVDRFGEVPAGRCNTDCLRTIGLHRMVLKPEDRRDGRSGEQTPAGYLVVMSERDDEVWPHHQ